MKIDWRVSAITAGSAFLLSVVIGVIGNVSFGVLILRAVTAAVLFGAGAIGVTIVIDRYLPELRRASDGSAASPTGNSVDIVVEGDDELEAVAEGSDENGVEAGATDNDVAELSVGDSDGVLEEVEESDDSGEIVSGATDGEVEEIEEIEEIASGEELPNVDSMADSFTEIPLGEDPGAESLDSGEDPALMARAIRTVLKREE